MHFQLANLLSASGPQRAPASGPQQLRATDNTGRGWLRTFLPRASRRSLAKNSAPPSLLGRSSHTQRRDHCAHLPREPSSWQQSAEKRSPSLDPLLATLASLLPTPLFS